MGTVRGTFDLNSRPASSALRDLRKEGVETDAVFERLGQTLDGVGTTKQREQVRLYREAVKRLGTQWTQTATKTNAAWTKMEKKTVKSTATQSAAIDALQDRVNELGRSSPTISVNTRGVAESIAEVELLQRRLNELGRSRPTARVGVGGTSLATARTAAAGGGSRGVKIPFAGSIPLPLIAGALGAAPPFLGGTTAVLGSAGAATLGAGAIGLGGLGALSAGIGSIAAVAIPAVKGLKESYKSLQQYNQAVALNGKNSTQAHTALEKLNAALQSAPGGTRGLINRQQRLSSRFQALTQPGQASFIGSLSNLLGAGNQLTPQLAGIANPFLAAGQRQSARLSGFLTGGTTRSFLGAAGNTATEVLPDVESTFQHVMATLMNISRASMPFFKQSIAWLEQWTAGWASSTGDIAKTRTSIGGMVSQLKSWGRLTGATFRLLRDLFSAGSKPGQGLVDDLTRQLNVWDAWVKKNPRQVRAFFRDAVDSTEKIAGALGKITRMLWRLGQLVTPLLTQLSQFVGFLDSAGLLSPGGLPLLLAGGAGIRNMMGGARGRILGGGAGGGGLAEGALLGGAAAGGAGGGLFSRGLGGLRGFGRVPVTKGMLGSADLAAMGMKSSRFSFGAAAGEAGGLLRTGGGAFLRGAGARFLPIAALMGGLQALSFPGSGLQRLQAGASGATVGFVPMPKTGDEQKDQGYEYAQKVADYYGRRYGSGSLDQLQAQMRAVRRKRHRLLTPMNVPLGTTTPPSLLGLPATLLSKVGIGGGPQERVVPTETGRAEAAGLGKHLENLRAQYAAQSRERGAAMGPQFRRAFEIRAAGEGGKAAFADVSGPILAQIKRLGPSGGRVLAQNVIAWTAAAKRQNPKLKKQYDEMAQEIEASFARMGKRIRIINGEIYTGSSKEWSNIEQAMKTPVERARAQMEADFTAIQRQAIGSLRAMGYSPSMAKKIVSGMESKNDQLRGAAEGAAKQGPGGYNSKIVQGASGPPSPAGARGLRIPGYGNTDHVPIGGHTGIGAPGELIVNPHTEARANRVLGMFGTSLERMQKSERYRASTPVGQMYSRPGEAFARGGRMGGGILGVGRWASSMGLSVGEGPGFGGAPSGGHATGSLHYSGLAYDISGSPSLMMKFRKMAERRYLGRGLNELFYDPYPYYIDAGQRVQGSIGGHTDHVHIGFDPGGPLGGNAMRGLMGGMRGLGGFKPVRAGRIGVGGAPGAAAQRGADAYAAGMNRRLRQHAGMSVRGGRNRFRGVGGGGSVPVQIGRILLANGYDRIAAAGIIGNAYAESTWNPAATGYGGGGLWGFTSSPYSLADLQAFAADRGKPWTSAALQTRFLLKHIPGSLRAQLNASPSPEAAAELFMTDWERPGIPRLDVRQEGARKAMAMRFGRGGRVGWGGWNARGGHGTFDRPTILGVGERGREDVSIRPHRPERKRAGGRRSLGSVAVSFAGAHFHVRKESDIEKIADAVGKRLAKAMAEDDGVDQEDVIG